MEECRSLFIPYKGKWGGSAYYNARTGNQEKFKGRKLGLITHIKRSASPMVKNQNRKVDFIMKTKKEEFELKKVP